jgi:3-oxoacyl-[acyl-carrier-protein] synthase II
VVSACASSGHALGDAFHLIKRGECKVAVTGGAEAAVSPLGMAGFCAARAMSTRNDSPETASRPFSAGRDGFVLGEGAAILVLEDLEHAVARGAKIYAEVLSLGASGDAHHITAPHPEGAGAMKAMRDALKWAGLKPEDVDYINAHGTSTELGDVAETNAVKGLFGDHAYKLAISSTKSMTGHLLGAAGGVEAAYTALALYHQVLPPTRNLTEPDPACDLDYVANQARPAKLNVAMSNSFGFGGTNSSLVLRRYQ